MSSFRGDVGNRAPDDANRPRVYVAVIAIETIVIAMLYWLGRHFS